MTNDQQLAEDRAKALAELEKFVRSHPLNAVQTKYPPILAVGGFNICYWSQLLELFDKLAQAEARVKELESERDALKATHAMDIRRLESAIQLHVIMKSALHGDEKAKMGILELADHIRQNDAALADAEGEEVE